MSYNDFELSRESGAPVELYQFVQGLQKWNYVSGETELIVGGQLYKPYPIGRDRIKQDQDPSRNGLSLTFPREDPFASQFIGFSPEEVTTVTILRGHVGDGEYLVYWQGRVSGSKASENSVTIECESIFTSIRRPGLRAKFEYGCRHVLYGYGCNVNRESYKLDAVISGVTGGVHLLCAMAATKPDGYYTGGILMTASGVSRFITHHVGVNLALSRPSSEVVNGIAVTLYPGCDRQKVTCENTFNNVNNFGGFPYIPSKNPFGGSSIA